MPTDTPQAETLITIAFLDAIHSRDYIHNQEIVVMSKRKARCLSEPFLLVLLFREENFIRGGYELEETLE